MSKAKVKKEKKKVWEAVVFDWGDCNFVCFIDGKTEEFIDYTKKNFLGDGSIDDFMVKIIDEFITTCISPSTSFAFIPAILFDIYHAKNCNKNNFKHAINHSFNNVFNDYKRRSNKWNERTAKFIELTKKEKDRGCCMGSQKDIEEYFKAVQEEHDKKNKTDRYLVLGCSGDEAYGGWDVYCPGNLDEVKGLLSEGDKYKTMKVFKVAEELKVVKGGFKLEGK